MSCKHTICQSHLLEIEGKIPFICLLVRWPEEKVYPHIRYNSELQTFSLGSSQTGSLPPAISQKLKPRAGVLKENLWALKTPVRPFLALEDIGRLQTRVEICPPYDSIHVKHQYCLSTSKSSANLATEL